MIKMKNWIILFVFLLFSCLCESQNLKGFEFKDNLLEARFGPENGYAIYDPGMILFFTRFRGHCRLIPWIGNHQRGFVDSKIGRILGLKLLSK